MRKKLCCLMMCTMIALTMPFSAAAAEKTMARNVYPNQTPAATAETQTAQETQTAAETTAVQASTVTGNYTVDNVDADYAIEADINLAGIAGSASIAKVAICCAWSAIAFDIVTDSTPEKTFFYRENIHSNAAGDQDYSERSQYPTAELGQTYHLMISFRKDGQCATYVNGELIETFTNEEMINYTIYDMSIEAGAMQDGQSVDAVFSNIRIKKGNKISSNNWSLKNMDNNPGIHSDTSQFAGSGVIKINGTIQLADGENWDTAYNGTSGKIYFE
ncbi:MAG: hypothetical protein LUD07_01395 [Clostridiales bacterium]|nr:hypothetical protein [Clostridiales bacterium]